MSKYNVVMGIEIHLELLTKTKMFSTAPIVTYIANHLKLSTKTKVIHTGVNFSVDETVLAYPGSMPQVNKRGVELGIIASHILGMKIDRILRFDRKHYWYHDLPKGFQITQHTNPLGSNGSISILGKEIRIERAHLEEDTAKTIKKDGKLLIDYNRCGNPLLEIVTEPDFSTSEQVVEYINTIKQLMFYAKVSNSKMEEGSLRCDINISLNKSNEPFGTRVEIKNLNSTSNIAKAIEFEIKRHSKALDEGIEIKQETRRFDETLAETVAMRSKEDTVDYKYIRETNIQDIKLDETFIKDAIEQISFNLIDFKQKLDSEGFNKKQINEIIKQFHLEEYIIAFNKYNKNIKSYFKIMLNDLSPLVSKRDINYLTPDKFISFIDKLVTDNISSSVYKKVLKELVVQEKDLEQSFKDNKIDFIEDETVVKYIIEPLITEDIKYRYSTRPERVEKQIMGQVMKQTQGKANPAVCIGIIKKLLK